MDYGEKRPMVAENLYALYLWILIPNITPEQALGLLETGKLPERTDITERDVKAMVKLRDMGFSYRQIGELYNMNKHAVQKRIIRYKKRKAGSK